MSRITLAQIDAFYWTATLSSVELAARRLSLSQPTVSLRLKTLETEIGKKLFERAGRGIRLTISGHSMLDDARQMLAVAERMSGATGEEKVGGAIRVGFAEGFAAICLSPILERLHALYPDLSPELMVSTTAYVEPDLYAHRLDLAFLVNPTEDAGFSLVPLGAQESAWIASTRWDLPSVVSPHELTPYPIIANQVGSINYRQVKGWFASAGLTPARLDICNSVAMLAHLVNTGVAVGIYPTKMAEREIREGQVRLLTTSPPIADTPIFAKYPTKAENANIRAFINTVRQVLSEMDYLKTIQL